MSNLRAAGARTLGDGLGHGLDMAVAGIIKDKHSGHARRWLLS
jgi:hypothetical protein